MTSNAEIFRYLTDDGLAADGTNQQVLGDGGSTAVPYYAGPAAGKYWHIERMIVYIEDGTFPKISEYGSTGALTNGIRLYETHGGVSGPIEVDLMGGLTAKKNADWASFCFDISLSQPGSGNGIVVARWTFGRAGAPLVLAGSHDDKLVLLNQDAMAALVDHRIFIQGIETIDPHTIPSGL